MACACNKRKKQEFIWTSEDGETSITYGNELIVKAKVKRLGGSYVKKDG